jgi:hypothetical protein
MVSLQLPTALLLRIGDTAETNNQGSRVNRLGSLTLTNHFRNHYDDTRTDEDNSYGMLNRCFWVDGLCSLLDALYNVLTNNNQSPGITPVNLVIVNP